METPLASSKRWYSSFACKRFRRKEKAERELGAIREASNRGFNTLSPAGEGVYDVRGVGSVLVTRTLPRMTTMNQIGWADSFPGQDEYDRRVGDPLERISTFVGEMHRSGIYHGDLQIKNIATDSRGRFLLFDLEDAEFIDDRDDPIVVDKSIKDLNMLVCSLVKRGFLWDASDDVFIEEIEAKVAEPYLMANENISPDFIDKFDIVIQDALLERAEARSSFSDKWQDTYETKAA